MNFNPCKYGRSRCLLKLVTIFLFQRCYTPLYKRIVNRYINQLFFCLKDVIPLYKKIVNKFIIFFLKLVTFKVFCSLYMLMLIIVRVKRIFFLESRQPHNLVYKIDRLDKLRNAFHMHETRWLHKTLNIKLNRLILIILMVYLI